MMTAPTTRLIKAAINPSSLPELGLWLRSQLVDYTCCAIVTLGLWPFLGSSQNVSTDFGALIWSFAGVLVFVTIVHFRESLHSWLLGNDRVPKCKQGDLTREHIMQLIQSCFFCGIFLSQLHGFIYTDTTRFGDKSVAWFLISEVYGPFYALLVLRDFFFLWPLHELLHSKQFYHLHKNHHSIGKDAQALHAFHIDLLDLIIENSGSPALLIGCQYLMGQVVGVHLLVVVLFAFHDGSLHSINPYSSMYYMPVLDFFLKPNIHHQLHHAAPHKGYTLFVPYHHFFPSLRQADIDYYNQIFGTDFYGGAADEQRQ